MNGERSNKTKTEKYYFTHSNDTEEDISIITFVEFALGRGTAVIPYLYNGIRIKKMYTMELLTV
jgi:hypothetical protein